VLQIPHILILNLRAEYIIIVALVALVTIVCIIAIVVIVFVRRKKRSAPGVAMELEHNYDEIPIDGTDYKSLPSKKNSLQERKYSTKVKGELVIPSCQLVNKRT
jgi:hypothetical protein